MFCNVRMNACEPYGKRLCSIILKIILMYQQWFQDRTQTLRCRQSLPHHRLRLSLLLMILNWILQFTILRKESFLLLLLSFFFFVCLFSPFLPPSPSLLSSFYQLWSSPIRLLLFIFGWLGMHSLLLPHFFPLFFAFLLCEYAPFSLFEPNMCPHAAAASCYVHLSSSFLHLSFFWFSSLENVLHL